MGTRKFAVVGCKKIRRRLFSLRINPNSCQRQTLLSPKYCVKRARIPVTIHLLFDIDGTLLLSGGAGWTAMQIAFQQVFEQREVDHVPVRGRTDRGIVAEMFCNQGVDDNVQNRQRFFDVYLSRLPKTLAKSNGSLLPGVSSLLNELSDDPDICLGLLTGNIEPAAWTKLKHFEIDCHFSFGGFGGDDKNRNQVAEKALAAGKAHSSTILENHRTIVIGDTVRDIQCARSIDCRCIGVLTGGSSRQEMSEADPDLLLDDLSDPTQFIDGIATICEA